MPSKDEFKLVFHSLKPCTITDYNYILCQFLDVCEEGETIIKRPEQLDRILLRYIQYSFDDHSRNGQDHVNKRLCALKFHILETKENQRLSQSVMRG